MSRPQAYRKPSNLSIRPPSPTGAANQGPITPTTNPNSNYNLYSPRRNPLPPSPTYSTNSYTSSGKGSSGVGLDLPPPVPTKGDKRLPLPPPPPGVQVQGSPYRGKGGWAVGAYDNKLVSSTLSHLPPIPNIPHSPTPSSSQVSSLHPVPSSTHLHHSSPRPSMSSHQSGSNTQGVVIFPDGTPLTDHSHSLGHTGLEPLVGRAAETMTMAHTSPSSPWSLLTVHVLPLFAGSALKTPIEDFNHLCHSHIVATSQRAPPARIVALLSSDLRDFIASGMLTLKAKFDTLEEGKVVSRAAEVWSFFWAQVLPYVEGVFLPFTQLRDVPSSTSTTMPSTSATATTLSSLSPIPVRHILLSGFLLHILLPLLPRLIPQILPFPSTPSLGTPNSTPVPSVNPPSPQDLSRILQMSLVLSTQAKYSSFISSSSTSASISQERDEEVRANVESLGQRVRYRMQCAENETMGSGGGNNPGSPARGVRQSTVSPRGSLGSQHKPSISQSGRYRRRGWRASSYMGQLAPGPSHDGPAVPGHNMSRQNSNFAEGRPDGRWGGQVVDEEEEDDFTPNPLYNNYEPGGRRVRQDSNMTSSASLNITGSMMSSQTGGSTMTGSTLTSGPSTITGNIRGESLASYGETPTPLAGVLNGGRDRAR